ncbi:hypothetical protein AWH56_011455 [Anaerobacillus isosaccharinicus]|uniref:Uncharacterized protein n=1 Tax=Anaerobacillus isosaccharinicus TaxID=1532552 RepID=A0A1S2M2W8_9BACI|nr:hypothetical protein [Anaerobacillus isosaccharinicus]MBA5588481.1 hypothetical protein [Anaerobacillus isosaccharinicus]QOY38094.1 hypothetical protein AWH56_011455 [Anaerobacillus isosaccharinicus]
MKQKVAGVFLLVAIIIISTWGFNQYLEKQRYERYLSLQIANNISTLISSVTGNQRIYNDIISSNTISLEQAETLYENNYSIVRITQDYQHLAIDLKRLDRDAVNNLPANNASNIGHYYQLLIWDIAEKEGFDKQNRTPHFPYQLTHTSKFEVEQNEIKKIEMIRELNELWLTAIVDNVIGVVDNGDLNPDVYFDTYRDAIKSDYWVKLVTEMDSYTKEYLINNDHLNEIGTILY